MADTAQQPDLTIDELARRSGMTVRNIRAHQSRGLLPPPEVRGRTGFYGPEHLTRLELIRELQGEGLNLEAIRRVLTAAGSSEDVLRFALAIRAPFGEDEGIPPVVSAADLAARYGGRLDAGLLDQAVELGLLRPLGDGDSYEECSPQLLRAGGELRELGIGTQRALEVADDLRRHADAIAMTFVDLFLEEVWGPFDRAGRPAHRWPEVRAALERLRPLAAESLHAMFGLVMAERADEAFGTVVARMAEEAPADAED